MACLQIWKMSKAGLIRRFDPYKIKTNSNFRQLTEQFSLNCLSLPTERITFTTAYPCQGNYLPLPVLSQLVCHFLFLILLRFVCHFLFFFTSQLVCCFLIYFKSRLICHFIFFFTSRLVCHYHYLLMS